MIVNKSTERFHFLDGLRGIASGTIVLHHIFTGNTYEYLTKKGYPTLAAFINFFGESGVVLFFVLSGVVLLRPYLRTNKKLEIGSYFFRRFTRIFPTYWAAFLFGSLAIYLIHLNPTWYSPILQPFTMKAFWEQAFIINFNYFQFNVAWWSLQIELLFYIVVPLVIILYPKKKKNSESSVWYSILITAAIALAGQLYFTEHYPAKYNHHMALQIFYKFWDYPVCFLLGVYLAARDISIKQTLQFLVLGVILISLAMFYMPTVYTGFGFLYAGLISLLFNKKKWRSFFERPLMIWIGERSYSLFVIHSSTQYFLYYLISAVTPSRNITYIILTRILAIPLALFMAMLLFHFVERKFAKGLLTADIFWPWQIRRLKPSETNNKPEVAAVSVNVPAS